jgi:hypothetical protein
MLPAGLPERPLPQAPRAAGEETGDLVDFYIQRVFSGL